MVTAIVLINVEQGRVPEVAQALIELPGVAEAYSVAGQYDLVAIVRVKEHDALADLVAGRVPVAGIKPAGGFVLVEDEPAERGLRT